LAFAGRMPLGGLLFGNAIEGDRRNAFALRFGGCFRTGHAAKVGRYSKTYFEVVCNYVETTSYLCSSSQISALAGAVLITAASSARTRLRPASLTPNLLDPGDDASGREVLFFLAMEPAKRPLFPIYDIMEHWAAFVKGTPEVKPVHHALYHALVQMCKQRHGTQRFNLNYLDGMEACSVLSRTTYLATLRDLERWGFASYTPGANGIKAPIVAVIFCASTEHQLSIYRASTYTSADTSAEHTIKEVKRLREEVDEKASSIEKLEMELAALKAKPSQTPAATTPGQALARATTDPDEEQHWRVGPLTKAHPFRLICERLGFLEIDFEHYRKQALVAAEDNNVSRTIAQWSSWIRNYLNNQSKHGPLLKAADTQKRLSARRLRLHRPPLRAAQYRRRQPEPRGRADPGQILPQRHHSPHPLIP
jgi:hypothetical protein